MTGKLLLISLLALAGVLTQGQAYAQTYAPGSAPSVTIITVGNVDKTLTTRVETWIEQTIAPVETRESLKLKAPYSLEKVYARVAESRKKDSLATLVLVGGIAPHGATHGLVSNRVAVIDVDMLKPADTGKKGWQEQFSRRVEKESLAGVAYALGMPACVFERCALKPAETSDELDEKAMNLCPPCQVKLQALLEGKKSTVNSKQ